MEYVCICTWCCVCMCVSCLSVSLWLCGICTGIWGRSTPWLLSYYLETGLSLHWMVTILARLDRQRTFRIRLCLYCLPQHWGCRHTQPGRAFQVDVEDLNSGPVACKYSNPLCYLSRPHSCLERALLSKAVHNKGVWTVEEFPIHLLFSHIHGFLHYRNPMIIVLHLSWQVYTNRLHHRCQSLH